MNTAKCSLCRETIELSDEGVCDNGEWYHNGCKPESNENESRPRNKKVAIHLLSAQIVNRVKGSEDSVMNLCQVVENLIREANL